MEANKMFEVAVRNKFRFPFKGVISVEDLMGLRKDNISGKWIRIITFPTKHHWRDESDLELIRTSAEQLIDICEGRGITSCYLTRPGCALGGLDWESQVRPLLEPILDDRFIIADYQL